VKNQWYCRVDGEQYGPFSWEQMRAMADEGRLLAGSQVRRDGDRQWFLAGQVPSLLKKKPQAAAPPKPPRQANNPSAGGSSAKLSSKPSKSGSSSSIHVTATSRPGATDASQSKVKRARPAASPPPPPSGTRSAGQAAIRTAGPNLPVVSVAVQPAAHGANSGEATLPVKSGPNVLMILGIVLGVLLLVGMTGAGLLAWGLFKAGRSVAGETQSTLAQTAADLEEELASAEGNPSSAAAAATVATRALTSSPANRGGQRNELAGRMKAQARWLDVTQIRGVRLSKMRLSVGRAWLASDATGTPVVPTLKSDSAERPTAEAAEAKYVFVELQIENEAPVPRKFTSWNSGGPRSVALADQTNAVVEVVPPSETPTITRLAAVDVSPGESVTDVLVFAAPAGDIEALHLLLEKKLLAEGGRDYFAFEIPLEALMESRGQAAAATMPTVAGRDLKAAADPVAAQGDGPSSRKGGPPTKEELDREFQALEREDKEAMKSQPAEASEPPMPPPEAKPAPSETSKPASKASDPPPQP
jgi:hypothetical protein